jgi:hypothetical protein
LLIRKEMMGSFDQYMHSSFVDNMIAYLRHLYPKEISHFSNIELRGQIENGITSAGTFCIDLEDDVARFLELQIILGQQFYLEADYEWATRILEDEERLASDRLDSVLEQISIPPEQG